VNGDRAAPLNTPPTGAPALQSVSPPPAGAPLHRDHAPPLYPANSVAARLFEEGFAFDFFQAVRLLERLAPKRSPVGRAWEEQKKEIVRFRAHLSLSFPPSSIYEIQPPSAALPVPAMIVAFMGLTGPSGILPQHYTELLLRLERDGKGPEKSALRAWLDLFNHRLLSLFWRAWEKYRFAIRYERGEYGGQEPDTFTQALFSLVGLGLPPLRKRLRVATPPLPPPRGERGELAGVTPEQILARIDDVSLLHYSGFFAHRPRCAASLEALLRDYFGFDVQVRQFQGQWLYLEAANQSRLGAAGGNCRMGVDLVAGARVWDVQGKFRVRIGPLCYAAFNEFLPDRSPVPSRKSLFLLIHLVRLYVGQELDFDVQLVLRAEEVPECRMTRGASGDPRLGWNTWIRSQAMPHDAADAVFAGEEEVWMNESKH
jgi:type VI secretion system protein ImpH